MSLPLPPNRFARGRAPLASFSEMVSFPPWPKLWTRAVLATVGVPPWMATAPPLTRMVPAALRLTSMVLSAASPMIGQCLGLGQKDRSDRQHQPQFHGLETGDEPGRSLPPGHRAAADRFFRNLRTWT